MGAAAEVGAPRLGQPRTFHLAALGVPGVHLAETLIDVGPVQLVELAGGEQVLQGRAGGAAPRAGADRVFRGREGAAAPGAAAASSPLAHWSQRMSTWPATSRAAVRVDIVVVVSALVILFRLLSRRSARPARASARLRQAHRISWWMLAGST